MLITVDCNPEPVRILCIIACMVTVVCAGFQLRTYSWHCQWKHHGEALHEECLPRPFHLSIAGLTLILALIGAAAELRVHLCGLGRVRGGGSRC